MPDFPHKSSEDPDVQPVNERSTSFIDGVAFLDFVRLKSLAATQDSSAAKNGATPASGCDAANDVSEAHDHALSQPPINSEFKAELNAELNTGANSPIEIEDWDSLFGAVEERLRTTVEKPDSATTSLAAQDNVSRIKSVVLDCVSALDQLHRALRQERSMHIPATVNGATSDTAVASPLTNGHDPSPNNQSR